MIIKKSQRYIYILLLISNNDDKMTKCRHGGVHDVRARALKSFHLTMSVSCSRIEFFHNRFKYTRRCIINIVQKVRKCVFFLSFSVRIQIDSFYVTAS